jgi:tetratricopeptide (TPR) repeat protein
MGARRPTLIAATALLAGTIAHAPATTAQPAGDGGEVEMGDGSGSGSGSAPAPARPTAGSDAGSDAAPGAPVKDPKAAKKWLAAATQLVQRGDQLARSGKAADAKQQYENAITAYQRAIEAGDDPTLLFALSAAEEKAGLTADAYTHVKQLAAIKDGVKPDVVKKASAKLDELAGKVGLVALAITPAGTQVVLGDKTVGEAPIADPLVLAPGSYTLTFSAAGYEPKTLELKVEAGSESERKVELAPMKVVIKPHQIEPEDLPPPPPPPDWMPLYIGAGVTGGMFLVAAFTGIQALRDHGTFTNPSTSEADRRDAQDNGKTYSHVNDVFVVGTLLAAGATGAWYYFKFRPAQEKYQPSLHAKVDVVPWVQPQAGGLFAVGRF